MRMFFDSRTLMAPTDASARMPEPVRLLAILAFALAAVTTMTVAQDLIHSRINNYSFYLSESLLFKAFWFSFFPILFFQLRFLSKLERSVPAKAAAVAVPTLVHAVLTPVFIYAVSATLFSHTYSLQKTFAYTMAEDIYKAVLIYGVFALFSGVIFGRRAAREDAAAPEAETPSDEAEHVRADAPDPIVVSHGRKYVPIALGSIQYISAATPYVAIHLENERYLHAESLRSMEAKLSAAGFVRVHKSTIVNLSKVRSYRSRMNGDYDVMLENGAEVRLSRNYVAGFKARIGGGTPQLDT